MLPRQQSFTDASKKAAALKRSGRGCKPRPASSSLENLARLREYFSTLPFLLPLDPIGTYENAGELYARCRRYGITPRSPHDCLIACIAIEHGTPLLHDDKDFETIARVEPRLLLEPTQEKI